MLLGLMVAAHPMVPFAGQGGAQAIEDAVSLTNYLLKEKDIPTALEKHQKERMPRIERIVEFGMTNGRLQMDTRWWWRLIFRGLVLWCPDWVTIRMWRWLYGYQPVVKTSTETKVN